MIIKNLPCLEIISEFPQIKGGQYNDYFDNRAVALAYAFADGPESTVVAGTSVYLDRGFSQAKSFAQAQSA